MRNLLKIVSFLALIVTVAPGFLVFRGNMTMDDYKVWVLIGTACWFASAPFWINKEKPQNEN